MRTLLIGILGLVGVAAGAASAAVTCVDSGFGYESCVIQNGSAPPNPENVIDDGRYTEDQRVYARNVGCPPSWGETWVRGDDPCPSPGEPTEVEVAEGGLVSWLRVRDASSVTLSGGRVVWYVRAFDSSSATLSGGWTAYVDAYDSSSVTLGDGFETSEVSARDSSSLTMTGGTVQKDLWPQGSATVAMTGGTVAGYLKPSDSSTVTMSGGWVSQLFAAGSSTVTVSGGTVWSQLTAYDSTTITIRGGTVSAIGAAHSSVVSIEGSEFEVDGAPVPYGDLMAEEGVLTGTFASGDSFSSFFYQGQGEGALYTGTITLVESVPEPASVVLHACALLALARLRRRASPPARAGAWGGAPQGRSAGIARGAGSRATAPRPPHGTRH